MARRVSLAGRSRFSTRSAKDPSFTQASPQPSNSTHIATPQPQLYLRAHIVRLPPSSQTTSASPAPRLHSLAHTDHGRRRLWQASQSQCTYKMAPKRATRASAARQTSEAAGASASSSKARGSRAAASSAGSPASAAAEAEDPALTSTQRDIRSVVKVESSRSPAEAYMALTALESRPMPAGVSAQELLRPRNIPRTACFDVSSRRSSWTSQVLCERCGRLNELLQGELSVESWAHGEAERG